MSNPLTIEADDDFVNDEIELKEGNVAIEMQEVKREAMTVNILLHTGNNKNVDIMMIQQRLRTNERGGKRKNQKKTMKKRKVGETSEGIIVERRTTAKHDGTVERRTRGENKDNTQHMFYYYINGFCGVETEYNLND
ncbi:hypothetical protein LXL04_007735 [Taraxacum kok-saghyz]